MRGPWRLLTLAATLNLTVAATGVLAQTVTVTKAPPGATIDVVLNATSVGTAVADKSGVATIPVKLLAKGAKAQTDVHIYVDVCEAVRRVTLTEPGWTPQPSRPGCARQEIFGIYVVRDVTSLVVEVGEKNQAVWIRQGSAPGDWLTEDVAASQSRGADIVVPKGFVPFGGFGGGKVGNFLAVNCNQMPGCGGSEMRPALVAGADYWINPYVAAEGRFIGPMDATAKGLGSSFRFDSKLAVNVMMIGGKVGVPVGRLRIYGEGGANYQWAMSTTTQSIDAREVTVDGVTTVIPGGTQTFTLKTGGWGWHVSGGFEIWAGSRIGVFAEAGHATLKGKASDGGEGTLDDAYNFLLAGVRVALRR
jgi:hypothetical protein